MSHILSIEESVQPEWIDYNGHMNVAYYVLAFDHATDACLDKIGMDAAYRNEAEKSVFVVESHIRYEGELKADEPFEIRSHILGYDEKRLHLYHEMYSKDNSNRCASIEIMALHVDMKTRKTSNFSSVFKAVLNDLCERSHQGGLPEGVGRKIAPLAFESKK